MQTVEIPRRDWAQRLNEFTAIHEGWLISMEVLGADLGAQPAIENLPLLGVSADRPDHDGAVAISVARSTAEYFTHLIHDVTRIWIERTEDSADAALQIEAADGTRTILRFRASVRPEIVDGLPRAW